MKYLKDNKFKGNMLLATYIVVISYIFLNLDRVGKFFTEVLGILSPFLIAIVIAFVLNLPMKFFENKVIPLIIKENSSEKLKKMKRPMAIILTLIVIIGVIVGLVLFVIPQLIESGSTLVKNIPGYLESLEEIMEKYVGNKDIVTNLWNEIMVFWQDIIQVVGKLTGTVLSQLLDITMGVTSGIINFFMGVLIGIYILLSKEKLSIQGKKIIYAFIDEKKADKIMKVLALANFKFSKFVSGQCIEALILGILCFIGMSILRMPYVLLVSTIIAVTALIPIFGALIGTIPGIFIIFMVEPIKAVYFLILIIIIQQIEGKFIYPMVVGNSVGLSALWVLFALTLGGGTFGIKGILIGIPLFGVIYSVLGIVVNRKIQEKNLMGKILGENSKDNSKEK